MWKIVLLLEKHRRIQKPGSSVSWLPFRVEYLRGGTCLTLREINSQYKHLFLVIKIYSLVRTAFQPYKIVIRTIYIL